jgi:hypothetical protein
MLVAAYIYLRNLNMCLEPRDGPNGVKWETKARSHGTKAKCCRSSITYEC